MPGAGERGMGSGCPWVQGLFGGMMGVFCSEIAVMVVSVQRATELCTLKWLLLPYRNFTLIKRLLTYQIMC